MNIKNKIIISFLIVLIALSALLLVSYYINTSNRVDSTLHPTYVITTSEIAPDYSDIIVVLDNNNNLVQLREEIVWTDISMITENGEESVLHCDSFGIGYRNDDQFISSLNRTHNVKSINIVTQTNAPPNYSIFTISDDDRLYNDTVFFSSSSEFICPEQNGVYLVEINLNYTKNGETSSYKYFFIYNIDSKPDSINQVTAYDDNGQEIFLKKEFMWSETSVVNEDGTTGSVSADGGQLGFMNKEEMVAGFHETRSVREILITNEQQSDTAYTIYDLSHPIENINFVSSNDASVVYHGDDLALPEENGTYAVAITLLWNNEDDRFCYKYFFKYIVDN